MKINIIHKTILSLFILSAFVFIFKTVSAQDFDYTYPVQYDTPATPWDGGNGNTSSYTWTDNIDCLYSVCNPTSADATPPTAVTTPVTTQDPQQSWYESSWETRTQPTTPPPQQTLPETNTNNPGTAPPYMGVGMTPGSGGEATPAPYSDRGDVIYCGMDYNGRAVMSGPTVGCKKCDDGRVAVGNNHDNCRGSGDTGTLVVPTPQTSAGASPQVTGAYILVSPSWSGNSSWVTAPSNWSGNSSWATAPSNWGGGSNWGGNTTWNNTTVTNITKYQCVDGSMVSDSSKCPIPKCSNGALDYPNCVTFKKCSNYANDYPACVTCPTGYDYWSSKCVAKCDRYSQRDVNTGSCNLRPCTNGAVTAPYCTDCPTGMDLWNGKCVASCPNNQYRDATGCVAYRCQNGATDYPNCGTCPAGKFLFSDGVCRACGAGTSWNGNSCIKNACNNDAINHPDCNLCANGMEYVDINKRCMYPCPSGYVRSGTSCNLISTS